MLTDDGQKRTKGLLNSRNVLLLKPSERIGSNYTPSARRLKSENLRYMKLRRKSKGSEKLLQRRSSLPSMTIEEEELFSEPKSSETPKGAIRTHSQVEIC